MKPMIVITQSTGQMVDWIASEDMHVLFLDWSELTPEGLPPDALYHPWLKGIEDKVREIGQFSAIAVEDRARWLGELMEWFEVNEPESWERWEETVPDSRLHWQAVVELIHDTDTLIKVHVHTWGPVEQGSGEPHRKCTGWADETHICGAITLDLEDDE